jgi:uncharacterized membrane protein
MTDTNDPAPILSAHVEETIRSIGQLHADHRENATPIERAVDRITAFVGRPTFGVVLTVVVAGWIAVNLLAAARGLRPLDGPPFSGLAGAVSLVSLYLVVLVLATQRRDDHLARQRELLLLELASLSEQKMAKMIQLLEEARRDNPLIHNRVDHEADAMTRPADPQSVLDAIKETNARAEPISDEPDVSRRAI